MTTRITGLATGLDVDELVKGELTNDKAKIEKQQKEKKILEIKQEMYHDVISQGSEFYSKYLEVKPNSLLMTASYSIVEFSSTNENAVTAKAASGSAIKDNYQVKVNQLARPASAIINLSKLSGSENKSIIAKVGDKEVSIDLSSIIDSDKTEAKKNEDLVTALNNNLNSLGLKAVNSEISGGIILKSIKEGKEQAFSISDSSGNTLFEAQGQDCEYTISSSTSGGEKTFSSSSNNATIDGITFSFTAITSEPVTITGKIDTDAIVDKLTNFFDDYNSLLTNYQTLLSDKYDKNYAPLTDEQKNDMTESQIEKWEEKVKKGQLHNDTLVQNFVTQMRDVFSASTAQLKKIGIKSVEKQYGVKAGTLQIDRDKLKEAIENDPEAVMKLFIEPEKNTEDADGKTSVVSGSGGVFTRMKNVLYNNTVSSSESSLIKKAGTATNSYNSMITTQLTNFAKKINQMKSNYSRKETKLYSKYAQLEKIMNTYNNQLANLQSYFN
jgi:flagellar hook-associated protein 2